MCPWRRRWVTATGLSNQYLFRSRVQFSSRIPILYVSLSSRGLGHQVFILATWIRIPLGMPNFIAQITLEDRTFKCRNCGFSMDRDVKSAIYILLKAIEILNNKQVSSGRRNIMPVEYESSVCNRKVAGKTRTLKQGAADFWKRFQKESKKSPNFWLTPEATCFS